jgi:hypothetical protein
VRKHTTPAPAHAGRLRRAGALLGAAAVAASLCLASGAAHGLRPLRAMGAPLWPGSPLPPPMPLPPRSIELRDPLLDVFGFDRFTTPSQERPSSGWAFRDGRYGVGSWQLLPRLSLGVTGGEPTELAAPSPALVSPLLGGPATLRLSLAAMTLPGVAAGKPCLTRAVAFVRFGGESDRFSLLGCDGSIAPDALDRLSVLARPAKAERPALPLPEDPEPDAASAGEWVEHVRLLSPRLVWAIEEVAKAFPHRTIYIISGYRPGGHGGLHAQARAIDLFVMNVANERVYKVCRGLPDMGCGYYPNNKFVHIDVRPHGTGKAYWVDTSGPGEPSHYVDAWPGVEKGGAAVWRGGGD